MRLPDAGLHSRFTAMECPYCKEEINDGSARCRYCGGEILYCPHCEKHVAVETRRKWVGLFRGVTQDVKKCVICGKRLQGPRW